MSDLLVATRFGLGSQRLLHAKKPSLWRRLSLPGAIAAGVAVPAAAYGSYYPSAWSWITIVFGLVTVFALTLRWRVNLSSLELTAIGALASLVVWIGCSSLWSLDASDSMLELQRPVVYLIAFLALLVSVRRQKVPELLGGVLAAITLISAYALATKLLASQPPAFDALTLNRLQMPFGYWNALGLFAAMGALLALTIAARGKTPFSRAAAGGCLPIVLATVYFTFGRGAWLALAAGLAASIALDARRLQLITALLVLTPASAGALWICSRSDQLTSTSPTAATQGPRVAAVILAASLATGIIALALAYAARRIPELPRGRLAYITALWAVGGFAAASLLVPQGGPVDLARKSYREFSGSPTTGASSGRDLNQRLFSLSGSSRADYWAVAWRDARDHRWLGSGAATYDGYWLRHRPRAIDVRDAHSLYVETLAELGPPGLVLLVVFLGIPLLAAARARRHPLTAGALAAYVAFLVHAGVDWDWEMTAVTITGLACGAALLISARADRLQRKLSGGLRAVLVVVVLGAVGFAFTGLASSSALSESETATLTENWGRAEADARKAVRWAPWSSQGWQALGEAQLEQAKLSDARASFRKALERSPRDWNLWLDLAFASDGPQRRQAGMMAIRLNPLSPEIAPVRRALGLPFVRSRERKAP